jgi:hypothetical protein
MDRLGTTTLPTITEVESPTKVDDDPEAIRPVTVEEPRPVATTETPELEHPPRKQSAEENYYQHNYLLNRVTADDTTPHQSVAYAYGPEEEE